MNRVNVVDKCRFCCCFNWVIYYVIVSRRILGCEKSTVDWQAYAIYHRTTIAEKINDRINDFIDLCNVTVDT